MMHRNGDCSSRWQLQQPHHSTSSNTRSSTRAVAAATSAWAIPDKEELPPQASPVPHVRLLTQKLHAEPGNLSLALCSDSLAPAQHQRSTSSDTRCSTRAVARTFFRVDDPDKEELPPQAPPGVGRMPLLCLRW